MTRKGLGVRLKFRHLDAVSLCLRGYPHFRAAERVGISQPGFTERLGTVRLFMGRSVEVLLRLAKVESLKLSSKRVRRLHSLANFYGGLVRYDELDALYWMSELARGLAMGMAPERGQTAMRPDEEDLLRAVLAGRPMADYARAAGQDRVKLNIQKARLLQKMKDASANFMRLHECSPGPREALNPKLLLEHAGELMGWCGGPVDASALGLTGRALQGIWLQEAGIRRAEDRKQMAAYLRGEIKEFKKEPVAEAIGIPQYLVVEARWRR